MPFADPGFLDVDLDDVVEFVCCARHGNQSGGHQQAGEQDEQAKGAAQAVSDVVALQERIHD